MTLTYCKQAPDLETGFFVNMDVDKQSKCSANPEKCYYGNSPSLSEMRIAFNSEYCAAWIARHLQAILATFGNKDNVSAEIIGVMSQEILANYSWLRASEFMLFCSRVKVGKYGKLAYGEITIDDITSKIPKFLSEREKEMQRYDRLHEQQERIEEQAKADRENVSHSKGIEIINAAAEGDIEAQHLIGDNPEMWRERIYHIKWLTDDEELKSKIEEYFGIYFHPAEKKFTACFDNSKYPKFLEGIERGFYEIIQ